MGELDGVLVFARVASAGSFTVAAKELALPKSTVSRRVAELEERLGVRLLQRTTRRLALTDAGRAYLTHANRIAEELADADAEAAELHSTPRGLVRVTAPLNFGLLAPALNSFLARHEGIRVEVVCTDRVVNLVDEAFDLAIRAGPLSDSGLVARSLGTLERVLVASPAYLERHGAVRRPDALESCDGLLFGGGGRRWQLASGRRTVTVSPPARLVANDFELLLPAVHAGLGIALLPRHLCDAALAGGTLVRVLPQWSAPPTPLHAVFPASRHLPSRVRALIEHLVAQLATRS